MTTSPLKLEVFKGTEASVNSYLISNGSSAILVDALRNSQDASELLAWIQARNLPLTHILMTHGHPDHFLGLGVLKDAFPEAQAVVASPEVKADIIGFTHFMESIGWLEGEPAMKPRTAERPDGFDYEGHIGVLTKKELTLEGGGVLQIETNYLPAESEHLTTIFIPDLNALLTSDFCYNGVHLWMGQGVSQAHIANWKTELNRLKDRYSGSGVTLYPGHGASAGLELIDTLFQYMADFEAAIAEAGSKEEVAEKMKAAYPDWEQDHFLLVYSIDNHFAGE